MVLAVIPILALLLAGTASADDVALRIGDSEVRQAEVELMKRVLVSRMGPNQPDESQLLRMAVDQVVTNKMLALAARKVRMQVSPAEVAKKMQAYRARYASLEEYKLFLEQLSMDEETLAGIEEEHLLVQLFIATQIVPLAAPTEEEAQAYYEANTKDFSHPEQVKLRVMLFKVASDADAATEAAVRARAEAAIARIRAGEDFAAVALEVSEDETSRTLGGELIWARRGLLAASLESAAFALDPGEMTGAIRTAYGYHVLKLEARRPPGISPFDEVKERLFQFLQGRNSTQLIKNVVTEMGESNPVVLLDPAAKAMLDTPEDAPPVS